MTQDIFQTVDTTNLLGLELTQAFDFNAILEKATRTANSLRLEGERREDYLITVMTKSTYGGSIAQQQLEDRMYDEMAEQQMFADWQHMGWTS